jgi:predicted ATPase
MKGLFKTDQLYLTPKIGSTIKKCFDNSLDQLTKEPGKIRSILESIMDDRRCIRSIRLRNLLSYGPDSPSFDLEPLNVLIGPNASGKSNLIEALSLLAAAPRDLQVPVREGGGVRDWLWKGVDKEVRAEIEVEVGYPSAFYKRAGAPMPLRYRLAFTSDSAARFVLFDEAVENAEPLANNPRPYLYYAYQSGQPVINPRTIPDNGGDRPHRRLRREDVSPEQSILSQRRDPDTYPELTYLARSFERIRFYREWNLGRYTASRLPQKTDLPGDALLEDAANLGLVLNKLQNRPDVKQLLLDRLRVFYGRVTDVTTSVEGGTIQIFFHEKGLKHPVPATRLSDGTLRYLCLLAVLCHPEPPPLLCIEEPELGLHPDVIPTVAAILVEASQRTQLIVTTHSDALISALSTTAQSVVVCERDSNGTKLQRLDPNLLYEWLERYRLGELWLMGELGGNPA